jgi:hypothetical protein
VVVEKKILLEGTSGDMHLSNKKNFGKLPFFNTELRLTKHYKKKNNPTPIFSHLRFRRLNRGARFARPKN